MKAYKLLLTIVAFLLFITSLSAFLYPKYNKNEMRTISYYEMHSVMNKTELCPHTRKKRNEFANEEINKSIPNFLSVGNQDLYNSNHHNNATSINPNSAPLKFDNCSISFKNYSDYFNRIYVRDLENWQHFVDSKYFVLFYHDWPKIYKQLSMHNLNGLISEMHNFHKPCQNNSNDKDKFCSGVKSLNSSAKKLLHAIFENSDTSEFQIANVKKQKEYELFFKVIEKEIRSSKFKCSSPKNFQKTVFKKEKPPTLNPWAMFMFGFSP